MIQKLIFLLCTCLFVSGCAPKAPAPPEKQALTVFAMDTVMNLTVYDRSDAVLNDAAALITDLESKFSTTDPNSDIHRLNEKKTGTVSDSTADLLGKALTLCKKIGGPLDLSVYPVVRAWGFTTGSYQIPDENELKRLLEQVDYRTISLDDHTVSLQGETEIDLGSVAKGYTGDRVLDLFRARGVTSALLNLGGNVQALGGKPDGSSWRVGIQDPNSEGFLGILDIKNKAVITSGGYERYFEGPDGSIYWHIIDPATGYPARNGLISATAVGSEGVYCDALSTSLFIMGPDEALRFWRTHRDFSMILITNDHEVLITPDLVDSFVLTKTDSYRMTVIDDAEN